MFQYLRYLRQCLGISYLIIHITNDSYVYLYSSGNFIFTGYSNAWIDDTFDHFVSQSVTELIGFWNYSKSSYKYIGNNLKVISLKMKECKD
jgi:hypothetical protein